MDTVKEAENLIIESEGKTLSPETRKLLDFMAHMTHIMSPAEILSRQEVQQRRDHEKDIRFDRSSENMMW